jgi:hypothetical protein
MQVVRYTKALYVKEGVSAVLVPVNHPSPLVTNGSECTTSIVKFYDPAHGLIVTRNTVYLPLQ